MSRLIQSSCFAVLFASVSMASDWPQWLGPNRNGASAETGLLTQWPAEGPKVLWRAEGGDGYSSIAVSKGIAATMVQRGGSEIVLALDVKTGEKLWETPIAKAYMNQYGNGPRATPTFAGEHVFVQSVTGPLVCLVAKTGDIVWQVDLLKSSGAKNISWGLSASPLVVGDLVYAVPGAGVAAYHKSTGERAWKTGDDKAAYSSPILAEVGGKKQTLFFTASGLLATDPKDGKEFWRVPWKTEFDCNIATPLLIGDQLFVSSGEEVGCALFTLTQNGPPEVVWESKGAKSVMINYWANSVVHNGHLYGLAGEFSKKIHLHCVDLKTGKLKWAQKDFGKGAILLADGHLLITTKAGDLVLAAADPTAYREKARVTLLGDNRTVPTLADRRLYLRDREKILCLDLAK